jgi:predicted ArsR family transcriptional regulator
MQTLLFDDVATYRAGTLAGHRGVETSREAASDITRVLNARQIEVLKALVVLKSASADEVATAVGRRVTSVRPRMTECKARGFLALTDERRLTADGKLAHVYRLSRQGAEYLAHNISDMCHAER